jgi:thiamine biosynthesis lipoprotein
MIRRAQPWLGPLVEITVEGGAEAQAMAATTAAFSAIARLHDLMSFHDGASDIGRINRAAPDAVLAVDPATWDVLALACAVARLSGGAFDIACAPWLVDWRMLPAPDAAAPPARASAAVFALEDGHTVRKLAPGWIDVGGIAKGYAVDAAVDVLIAAGAAAGCVNAGGDLRAFGGLRVPVAIRAPHAPGRAARHLTLCDAALATSASYFSKRSHAGRPVSALLDARDGRPQVGDASATVRAARCAHADALTKVVLATGDAAHPALAAFDATAFLI